MTTTNAIQIVIHSLEEIPNNDKSASKVVENIESDEIPTCRICMEPQLEDLDPIMPLGCGCRHGLGQAHQNCLIKWFCEQRFESILNFDGIPGSKDCEICKKKLSPSVRGLINDYWRPFLERKMAETNTASQGIERMAAQRATQEAILEDQMTRKFKRCCISVIVIIFFGLALAIYEIVEE